MTRLCGGCGRRVALVGGIPDFFEGDEEELDRPNRSWLGEEAVAAREIVYELSHRELVGMAFCMAEVGKRSFAGCRILEVAAGTGHFTRWLREVCVAGTEIYAFDVSWPILARARAKVGEAEGVHLFRGNARGRLPFLQNYFDMIVVRLAPFGQRDVPKIVAAHRLLKRGGWYFGAGWQKRQWETSPVAWALAKGYDEAAFHEWGYWRDVSAEEGEALIVERRQMVASGFEQLADWDEGEALRPRQVVHEHLLMARKGGGDE
ncbi:MAG TPA: class I SAM-dependent methyltransferase [Anaerolineae bacterium]|nr:class I SAM-dependent methyltransferase [Anaerolineae bacterium]